MSMALLLRCNRSTIANVWRPTGPVTYGGLWLDAGAQSVSEVASPTELPDRTAQPRQMRAAMAEPGRSLRKKRAKVQRKYATLSSVFMRAPAKAQILSVYKTRGSNPAKVADYKAALAAGDCTLTGNLPQNILDRYRRTARIGALMRYQFVVDFPGTLAELITSFPPGADVVSLHHVPNVEVGEAKPSRARTHMGEHVVAGIFADFDAGLTIEAIAAKTGLLLSGGGCSP